MTRNGLIAAACAAAAFCIGAPTASAQLPPECYQSEAYSYCEGSAGPAAGWCEGVDHRNEGPNYSVEERRIACAGESPVARGQGECGSWTYGFESGEYASSGRDEWCYGDVRVANVHASGECGQGGYDYRNPDTSGGGSWRYCDGSLGPVGEGFVYCSSDTSEAQGTCAGLGYLGLTGGFLYCESQGTVIPVETPVRDDTVVLPSSPPECEGA